MLARKDGVVVRQPGPADFPSVFDLRWRVLDEVIGGERQTELSAGDQKPGVLHVAAFDNGAAVSTVRVDPYPDGGEGTYLVRKMATDPAYQRRGIGRDVLTEAERLAAEHGARRIILYSRADAVPFYQTLGYTLTGEVAVYNGDRDPEMVKDLPAM